MKAILLAALVFPSLLAAAPGDPPPGRAAPGLPTPVESRKTGKRDHDPLRPENYEQCLSSRTLPALVAAGPKAWGFQREVFQARLDELAGVFQCRALAEGEAACAGLGKMPDFPAAATLEAECRSEHHLLVFYREMTAGRQGAAQEACTRWHEANKKYLAMKVDPAQVCRLAVEALAQDPAAGCARLGKQVGRLARADRRAAAESELVCAAYLSPSQDSCSTEDIPVNVKTCVEYGHILTALRSGKPKACPSGWRRRPACRALLSKEPEAACAAAAAQWTERFCEGRFQ